jgi:hypothetical protein
MTNDIEVWEVNNNGALDPFLVTFQDKSYEIEAIVSVGKSTCIDGRVAVPYEVVIDGKNKTLYKCSEGKWFVLLNK